MSALLFVLLLYNLPRFIDSPGNIPLLPLLIAVGLVLDATFHLITYKRPVCAVSAAVTALIIYTLSPGAPVWTQCAALGTALVIGKAIWGGTGKNLFNPAMLGLIFLAFLSPIKSTAFEPSPYLLPAALLSLPFLYIRPHAGGGMILGMAASLFLQQSLTPASLLSKGVFFWGCLVITDPVTTTSRPAVGFIIGLLAGFIPLMTGGAAIALPLSVLGANLLSHLTDRLNIGRNEKLKKTFSRKQKIALSDDGALYTDLTGESAAESTGCIPSCGEILRRIEKNNVFGMGGAAFPVAKKIRMAMESEAPDKYFIVNAAECDPGLIHDKWLLKNRSAEIVRGIEILQKCIPFKSVTVAAKDFAGYAFAEIATSYKVSDFYPAGAEKILVRHVLKTAPADKIPAACGILVLNVQTVYAIFEAVLYDRRADTRFLTVADLNKGTGRIVRVKLGTSVRETAQKILGHAAIVYSGGGIMNARLSDDNDVIGEKTNFLAAGQVKGLREAVCSQCNFCSAYCPASLHVRKIAHFVDAGKMDQALRLHPEKCMECALCSAVCLAGRNQAKRVKAAKAKARA